MLEFQARFGSQVHQLFTVMIATISTTHVKAVRSKETPYSVYEYLNESFETVKYLELKNTRKIFRNIGFQNLRK